jgi:hypothetical protein
MRLLLLGFCPAALGSRGTGTCCDPHNAVVDGGFADLDSVVPTKELKSRVLFDDSLLDGLLALRRTIQVFLVGRKYPIIQNERLLGHRIAAHVGRLCIEALNRETQLSELVDNRVKDFFSCCGSLVEHIMQYSVGVI